MRFVAVKSEEQQAVLTLHRARSLQLAERTALVNQIRGLLSEYGLVLPQGVGKVRSLLPEILEDGENALPGLAREVFADLYERLRDLDERIQAYDRRVAQLACASETAQRLMQVEGVGPLTATALIAAVGDARHFRNGRQLAAWLGLVARQRSSGGKARHGRITKRGDVYLRTLLVHGARAVLCRLKNPSDRKGRWALALKARRGFNKAVVALAARHARILWALLSKGTAYEVAT